MPIFPVSFLGNFSIVFALVLHSAPICGVDPLLKILVAPWLSSGEVYDLASPLQDYVLFHNLVMLVAGVLIVHYVVDTIGPTCGLYC